MKSIILYIFLTLNISNLYSQETFAFQSERHYFNKSLINNNITNVVKMKKFSKDYVYEAKYLGKVKTIKGKIYYIINSSYYNTKNLHNDNQIFIYNNKKEFIGYYNLSTNYQLPTKLINGILYFKTNNCNNQIDFKFGIPKLLCIGCKEEIDCLNFQ